MDGIAKNSPPVVSNGFRDDLPGPPDDARAESVGAPIDLALEATEAALGQVTKAVIDNIRHGGDGTQHVEAAERDLRSALRQLTIAKPRPGEPL